MRFRLRLVAPFHSYCWSLMGLPIMGRTRREELQVIDTFTGRGTVDLVVANPPYDLRGAHTNRGADRGGFEINTGAPYSCQFCNEIRPCVSARAASLISISRSSNADWPRFGDASSDSPGTRVTAPAFVCRYVGHCCRTLWRSARRSTPRNGMSSTRPRSEGTARKYSRVAECRGTCGHPQRNRHLRRG